MIFLYRSDIAKTIFIFLNPLLNDESPLVEKIGAFFVKKYHSYPMNFKNQPVESN